MAKRGPKPKPKVAPKPVGRPKSEIIGKERGMRIAVLNLVARIVARMPLKVGSDPLKVALGLCNKQVCLGAGMIYLDGEHAMKERLDVGQQKWRKITTIILEGRQTALDSKALLLRRLTLTPPEGVWLEMSVRALDQFTNKGELESHINAEAVLVALGWPIRYFIEAHSKEKKQAAKLFIEAGFNGQVFENK